MITDPISDMLTRIRNAQMVHHSEIILPFSQMKLAVAKVLEHEEYVGKVELVEENKQKKMRIELKYRDGNPVIQNIRRVSRPGNRVYAKSTVLPRVISDFGIAVVSTSNGIMTNKEARARHLGGEVICEIF